MVHIVRNILGRAVDLTATEKHLSVTPGLKNDTEGGGVVDGMTSGVPV